MRLVIDTFFHWFSKNNLSCRLLIFIIFHFVYYNLIASEIRIKQIQLNDHPFNWSTKLVWRYADYSKLDEHGLPKDLVLLFPYYSISFKLSVFDNSKLIMRNKLENYDKNWTKCDTNKSSTYHNLQNGKYTYRVQGLKEGKIIDEKIFNFEIKRDYSELVFLDLFQSLLSVLFIIVIIKMK